MTTTTVPRTQDLSEGALGMALLDIERGDLSTARRHLTEATARGVSTGSNASLFHGAPALEFVPPAPTGPATTSARPSTASWMPDSPPPTAVRRPACCPTSPNGTSSAA